MKSGTMMLFASAFLFSSCDLGALFPFFADTSFKAIEGTWIVHRLEVTQGGGGSWAHSIETIGRDGSSEQLSFLNSNGNSTPRETISYTLDEANAVLSRSDNPSYRGMLMRDNEMIVATTSASSGSAFRMTIGLKAGGSFVQSALTGSYNRYRLRSGALPAWSHGRMTIDAAGNASSTWTSLDGYSAAGALSILTLSPSGTVGDGADAIFHGTLARSGNLLVGTTGSGGSSDLILAAEVPLATTYATTDLSGTWRWHTLQSGTGHEAWIRGRLVSDLSGNVTVIAQGDSAGGSQLGDPFTWAIASDGTITRPANPSFHGFMLEDKKIIIATRTSGDGLGYRLTVYRKE